MLSKERINKTIQEDKPYIDALLEYERTGKLKKVSYKERLDITIEEGVVLGHQVMFLAGKHDIKNGCVEKEANSAGNPAHFIKKLN